MAAPKLLDLDAISSPAAFSLKLNGKEHPVVETTIKDFIETTRMVAEYTAGGVEDELELMIKLIMKAVPSIKRAELEKLTFTQLRAIDDFVRTANGEKAETVEDGEAPKEEASGNAPKAN